MNNLICIPLSRQSIERAVSLVPSKYLDATFRLAEHELKSVLDIGMFGYERIADSLSFCKWFNSEVYLSKFVDGLRDRTDTVFVDLSDRYKEALERLPHTNQVPSWMRHDSSYKHQLYALATHDAIERLFYRFETLGTLHNFVNTVQDATGMQGREAFVAYAFSIGSNRASYRVIRQKGFWPKRVVRTYQGDMYDQSYSSFLGRSRFATALGDYSQMYRVNWDFNDSNSASYQDPKVVQLDQLQSVLATRISYLHGCQTTTHSLDRTLPDQEIRRGINDQTEEQYESFIEEFPDVQRGLRNIRNLGVEETNEETNAGNTTSDTIRNFAEVVQRVTREYTDSGWVDESVPPAATQAPPTRELIYETTAGHDESQLRGRFCIPDAPVPTEIHLRERIIQLASQLNVPETEIIQTEVFWTTDDSTPENLVSNVTYSPESSRFRAMGLQVRPQPCSNTGDQNASVRFI